MPSLFSSCYLSACRPMPMLAKYVTDDALRHSSWRAHFRHRLRIGWDDEDRQKQSPPITASRDGGYLAGYCGAISTTNLLVIDHEIEQTSLGDSERCPCDGGLCRPYDVLFDSTPSRRIFERSAAIDQFKCAPRGLHGRQDWDSASISWISHARVDV